MIKKLMPTITLLEILLNNLISNAIRHNYKGGEIIINLTAEKLVIKNTGEPNLYMTKKYLPAFINLQILKAVAWA